MGISVRLRHADRIGRQPEINSASVSRQRRHRVRPRSATTIFEPRPCSLYTFVRQPPAGKAPDQHAKLTAWTGQRPTCSYVCVIGDTTRPERPATMSASPRHGSLCFPTTQPQPSRSLPIARTVPFGSATPGRRRSRTQRASFDYVIVLRGHRQVLNRARFDCRGGECYFITWPDRCPTTHHRVRGHRRRRHPGFRDPDASPLRLPGGCGPVRRGLPDESTTAPSSPTLTRRHRRRWHRNALRRLPDLPLNDSDGAVVCGNVDKCPACCHAISRHRRRRHRQTPRACPMTLERQYWVCRLRT